jgi:hypothetical protein
MLYSGEDLELPVTGGLPFDIYTDRVKPARAR